MTNKYHPKVRLPKQQRSKVIACAGRKGETISHGLHADIAKRKIDGRTGLGKALRQGREGLARLFPQGPNEAASLLIDRIVFKALKLALYEATDLKGLAGAGAAAEQRYITMSNSLREDIRLLSQMAQRQQAEPDDPDLKEYLEAIKRAAKAQVIRISQE